MATQTEEQLNEDIKNLRKLILIENVSDLGLKGKRKRRFVDFYYDKLNSGKDSNLLDSLDEFKHLKK